jgi:bacteriorhodopsin
MPVFCPYVLIAREQHLANQRLFTMFAAETSLIWLAFPVIYCLGIRCT